MPNVLLVVLDTARRDVIEPYGATAGSTPTIAQLARRGHAHPRAYATSSWTLPSHASMFTGLLPRQLGLAQPPGGAANAARGVLRNASARLLPEVLRQAGYATHGLTTNLWVSDLTGFDLGFDTFRFVNSGRDERMNALLGQGRRAELAWVREGLRSNVDDGAAEVGRELRHAIEQWSGQPTFWFVNLCECHSPYLPPRPWNDLGPWDRARAALDNKEHLSFLSICKYAAGRHQIPPAALQRLRHLYGRAVAYMDNWLSGIVEALDGRGILDQTLLIVTSDHGENFGEGGLIAHGFSVDQRLIHMPLVVAGPESDLGQDVFSLAALPRVIAEAVGLPDHPWPVGQLPEGVAIAQYDPMAPPDDERVQKFAREWDADEEGIERVCATFTCATDGTHKLLVRDGQEFLFNLTADPDETTPLEAEGNALTALRTALEHPAVQKAAPAGAASVESSPASDEEIAELERRMQLLGYM